jgi:hypothetical protein
MNFFPKNIFSHKSAVSCESANNAFYFNKSFKHFIYVVLIYSILYDAILCVIIIFHQAYFIFHGEKPTNRTTLRLIFHWSYQYLHFDVYGEKTHAWLLPVENARGVILFYGDVGSIADWFDSTLHFSARIVPMAAWRHTKARANFERANEPKQFLELHGDHNEAVEQSIREYKQAVKSFFDGCFLPRPSPSKSK